MIQLNFFQLYFCPTDGMNVWTNVNENCSSVHILYIYRSFLFLNDFPVLPILKNATNYRDLIYAALSIVWRFLYRCLFFGLLLFLNATLTPKFLRIWGVVLDVFLCWYCHKKAFLIFLEAMTRTDSYFNISSVFLITSGSCY